MTRLRLNLARWQRWTLGVVAVAALSTGLVWKCVSKGGGAGQAKAADSASAGKKGAREAQFPVEIMTVGLRPHDLVISSPGSIEAFEQIQVTARVPGVLDKIAFAEGQEVKKGQMLALIDSRRYALGVSQARAALAKSEATAADFETSLKRREDASNTTPGLVPGEEIDSYRTKLRTANADVEGANQALSLAQLNLSDSSVTAQIEGVIQTRNVQTGQYVQAGTVLATLLRRDPLLLRFHVATSEAPRIHVGAAVEFTLKESQQTYGAKITLIAAAAEPESRLVPVTAEVDSDKKFWLRPGSFALVKIKLTPDKQFPMIPQTAARPSDHGFLGYVVTGNAAHEKVLQLGMHTEDGWVEVRDGLGVGDVLVTKGLEALSEGAKVQIQTPRADASGTPSAASTSSAASSAAPRASSAP